jgi:hypothetical protein
MRNNQTLFFILAIVILVLIGLWALNASGPDVTSTTTTTTERPSVSGAGERTKTSPTTPSTERSTTGPGTGEAGKTAPATPLQTAPPPASK